MAVGFVGFGIAFRGVGIAGVRALLVDLDGGAIEDLCCEDALTVLGLVGVGAGISLGTTVFGVGSWVGFLVTVGSLERRGMPPGRGKIGRAHV